MSALDYYEVLQISPNAEQETIHRVFRLLAMRYHPDNPETGDAAKFLELNEAYEVLQDQQLRTAYDLRRNQQEEEPLPVFWLRDFTVGSEGENNRRQGLLCLLYQRRRTDPESPGISVLQLEKMMAFPREHLRFSLWFLQEKKFIRFNQNSEFEITGEGTEFLETHTPKHEDLRRMLNPAQSAQPEEAKPEPVTPKQEPVSAPPVEWQRPLEQTRKSSWPDAAPHSPPVANRPPTGFQIRLSTRAN